MGSIWILQPVPAIELTIFGVAERGDVVRQRVEPDVDDLTRIARHRNPPTTGPRARSRDTDVLEPRGDERADLVPTRFRQDPELARIDQRKQAIAVAGEAKEVVLFLDDLGRGQVLWTKAVDQLVRGVEQLAADAVQSSVGLGVD